jgi:hypothetical protein
MNIPYLKEVLGEIVKKDIPESATIISSARHYHAIGIVRRPRFV